MDMMNGAAVWVALAVVFVAAVITKIARANPPSSSKLPPPPVVGTSTIGLVRAVLTKGIRGMLEEQYTKLGSVFTIHFLGMKTTFLIGPEASAHFYQGLEPNVSNANFQFTVPMFGKSVMMGVDAATRAEQHRFYVDALKSSNLKRHVGPMQQEVEKFFARWGEQGTVDLKKELKQLFVLISARCLLGQEVRDTMFEEVSSTFRELVDNGFHFSCVMFPYAPTPWTRARDRAHVKLYKIFSDIIKARRSSNRVVDDVLQNIMDSKYKNGRPTTEEEVTGLVLTVLLAAHHTSSNSTTWTAACLLNHPRWMEAVIQEQQQIIHKYGDSLDFDALLEMGVLQRCIKEALRVHPPISMLFRTVNKSLAVRTKEGSEYEIPSGYTLASPLVMNSYLPHIYKDADVYDPDRFGPERMEDKAGGKFSYISFSGGRHACAGEAYAYLQAKVMWSHLLRNFDMKLVSPYPKTNWRDITMEPIGPVTVSYKRRQLPKAVMEN
ncbi:hypothetical protein U9M48_023045 [Paspalum notatum var. saurae]|uniref:Obtusifoliol 14-alpha demethylase n=1 Tax=Paspalum notatum var. saurae TaxID=547442 RepID=A0AAQ3WVR8_PASNO